jgi:histidinol-phosphate/aromatic aminotransferase/cobyric acid decarboxylase-like protein
LVTTPSHANFVWIDVRRSGGAVSDALRQRGFLIRSGAVHDAPSHVRVTCGRPDENDKPAASPLVAFRTFSKIYGLAGVRAGYLLRQRGDQRGASVEISQAMERARETFAFLRALTEVVELIPEDGS